MKSIGELEQAGKLVFPPRGNYSYYLEKRRGRRIEQEVVEQHRVQNFLFKKRIGIEMRETTKSTNTKSKSRIDDFHTIKEKAEST